MYVAEICRRSVVTAPGDARIADAARLMRSEHVGSVVVLSRRKPIGIITDRDIVVRVIAAGLDATALRLRDVLVWGVVSVPEHETVFDAIALMRKHGVRRLPVVDQGNRLVGILAASDLLPRFSRPLAQLARVASVAACSEIGRLASRG